LKKVVAINGSPRKRHTQGLLEQISALLAVDGIDVTVINLYDYHISACAGCEVCMRKTSHCWQKDDSARIMDQMMAADGLILASPVYVMSISGLLKTLIDKTAWWVHRPQLVGKPVLSVATTAGAGLKQVLDYLETVSIQWGMQLAGRIGRKISNTNPVNSKELESFQWHLHHPTRQFRPSINQLMNYQVQKVLAMKVLPNDKAYWQEKGWDHASYYYPCVISPINRLIACMFYTMLSYRVPVVDSP
jgi:multimeric flavodoxin WrbA